MCNHFGFSSAGLHSVETHCNVIRQYCAYTRVFMPFLYLYMRSYMRARVYFIFFMFIRVHIWPCTSLSRYADELQRWQMCLGKHNLTQSEAGEQCYGVLGIYRHESFKYPTVPSVEFDIALVRLDGEVTPTEHIDFACMPSVEEMLPGGKNCYATGWGDETGKMRHARFMLILTQWHCKWGFDLSPNLNWYLFTDGQSA